MRGVSGVINIAARLRDRAGDGDIVIDKPASVETDDKSQASLAEQAATPGTDDVGATLPTMPLTIPSRPNAPPRTLLDGIDAIDGVSGPPCDDERFDY